MIELQWIIGIALIAIASPLWVYGDAKERGISDRGLWTLLAFLVPIAGLVLYLLLGRKPSEEKRVCPHCGSSMTAQYAYCPSCGAQSSRRLGEGA